MNLDHKTALQVEIAKAADVPQLVALVNKAYRGESAARGWTSEAHLLDGTRIDEATLSDYLAQQDTVILKCSRYAEQIDGCVYLELTDEALYLGMLSVDPDLQNTGIGKYLLKQAERYALSNKRDKIKISVIEGRNELIEWYQRYGYHKTGDILPFPTETKFGVPKQALQLIVMEKQLLKSVDY